MIKLKKEEEKFITLLRRLPIEKIKEVFDFATFLKEKAETERTRIKAAEKLSEKSFAKVWDNDEDAAYDSL